MVASVVFAEDVEPVIPTSVEELRTEIAAVLEENDTPGVGIALVSADGLIWSGGVGLADRDTGVEMTADHLLRIGSISKLFVGIAAMQQVESGNLSLDARLQDLAPTVEFANRWEETDPVRLVNLLEHTAGFDDVHLVDYAHNDPDQFGAIGLGVFVYGRKQRSAVPLVCGLILMVFPYFVSNIFLLVAIGFAVIGACYFIRA